jgi:isopenicillin-N N-acyltransferase-like protein
MKILDCRGTGTDKGRSHGEEARDLIRDAIARWADTTLSSIHQHVSIRAYAVDFLNRTSLLTTARKETPDLVAEVEGIAEASGVPFELIAAYNLMDEQWWFDLGRNTAEPGCSAFSKKLARGMLLAQNMDLPAYMDGSQVILRIDNGNTRSLVLSAAGLIGLTGINGAGFAICVNTLLMLNHNSAGLPVAFALRSALSKRNARQARLHLQGISHASGQHYAIADMDQTTSLECSKAGAVSVPVDDVMLHTNHPLQSVDLDASVQILLEKRGRIAFSKERLAALATTIGDLHEARHAVSLLSDPHLPICVVPTASSSTQTFGSVAYYLTEHPQAHFCLGKPGTAPWIEVGF